MEEIQDSDDLIIDSVNKNDEESEREITPLHYDLTTYPADFTLEVLYQKWKNGDILIPKFQRGYIWDMKRASRLVESVMMGLPIPPVFFYLDGENRFLTIDGRQRLQSIFYFMEGLFGDEDDVGKRSVFKLNGINPKNPLFGRTYEEFNDAAKRRFNDYVLRSTIIRQLNPKDESTSIYHIFERLNTGGMSLLDQEVRNCIYGGKLNDLLLYINKDENWRKILGKPKIDRRQKDVGYVLRCMSLFHNYRQYKKPMRDFLSEFMRKNQNPSDEFLKTETRLFEKTCHAIIKNLDEKPFHPNRTLSPPILDSVFVAFAQHLEHCPNDVLTRFKKLCDDKDFQKATSDATTDSDVVVKRIDLAENILFR